MAGHNRISTQALTSVARAAAADVLGVLPAQVRVSWADDAGALGLSVSAPISAPPLVEVLHSPARVAATGGSILARATAAKAVILAQVERLTGSHVSQVNMRVTGIQASDGGRVQ
ncbi:hypothetical protein [Specibacter sp. RAF43]|uniref:hypothetical protein n=1 Tax=Specibacter sp. RAF43 TaxID=3233057 RepID=UPI003F9CD401